MFSRSYGSWFRQQAHPPVERLIEFLDGEASPRSAQAIRRHLERCWACRAERDRLQSAVSAYVQQRQAEVEGEPPASSANFEDRLRRYAESLSTTPAERPQRRRLDRWFRWTAAAASAAVAAVVVMVLLLPDSAVRTVSASELLRLSAEAEFGPPERREKAAPLIYQKLSVRRFPSGGAARRGAETLSLEIWEQARANGAAAPTGGYRRAIAADGGGGGSVDFAEIERVLAENGLDPRRPLSARGFARWRETVEGRTDRVAEEKLGNGAAGLRLTTVAPRRLQGRIAEGELVVDVAHWRPVFERLAVPDGGETRVYEFAELDFRVLDPVAGPTLAPVAPAKPVEPVEAVAALERGAAPVLVATSLPVEIQVRYALHRIGACLGEPVRLLVDATGGPLTVQGIVASAERKRQILDAIAGVEGAAASVRLDLLTVEEAQRAAALAGPLADAGAVRIEAGEPPLRESLERVLGTPAAAAGFSTAMVAASNQMMASAWALRHLTERFAGTNLRPLPAQTRWLLEAMIDDHLESIRSGSAALRHKMGPLVNAGGSEVERGGAAAWPGAGLQLFKGVESAHTAILLAFAASGEKAERTPDPSSIEAALAAVERDTAALKAAVGEVFQQAERDASATVSVEPDHKRERK